MNNEQTTEDFLELYNQEQRSLYAYVRTMLFYSDDVEDVFQETCIALWRSFSQYERGTNFSAWARQIARHRVLAHGKKRMNDKHVFCVTTLEKIAEDVDRNFEAYDNRGTALDNCLKRLSDSDRKILIERYTGERSTVQLAKDLNRSLSTLYKSLRRIRRSLYNCVNGSLGLREKST